MAGPPPIKPSASDTTCAIGSAAYCDHHEPAWRKGPGFYKPGIHHQKPMTGAWTGKSPAILLNTHCDRRIKCYVALKTRQFDEICFALTIVTGRPSIADRSAMGPVPFSRANDSLASQLKDSPFRKNTNLCLNAPCSNVRVNVSVCSSKCHMP